jgi:protease-4
VVAGKVVLAGLIQKLGITVEGIGHGADAGMFSVMQDFSPSMQHRVDDMLDRIYQGFKGHVAEGRHLSPDAVEAAAKGRVWTGEEAKAKGLVDAMGGYAAALGLVREAAKLPADAPLKLVVFPRSKAAIADLVDLLSGTGDNLQSGVFGALGDRLAGVVALFERFGLLAPMPGTVRMPPIGDLR